MPSLSGDEARKFLNLLKRVDDDMREAMADDLPEDEYREKWGAPRSQTGVEAGRKSYRAFVEHAYCSDSTCWDDMPDLGQESLPNRDGFETPSMDEFVEKNQDADDL